MKRKQNRLGFMTRITNLTNPVSPVNVGQGVIKDRFVHHSAEFVRRFKCC